MALIKRYPNRKLYNTATKDYITLDKIAELIRGGEEIHVVDYATGKDLTALILTQVLFEQAKQQTGFLPRTVLTGLIQAGNSHLGVLQRTLTSSLGLSQPVDEEIRRRINLLVEQGEMDLEAGELLIEKLLSLGEEKSEPAPGQALIERIFEGRGVATRRELSSLQEQMDILSARLDELNARERSDQNHTSV